MKTPYTYFAFSMASLTTMAAFSTATATYLRDTAVPSGATRTKVTYGPFHTLPEAVFPHSPYMTPQKPCEDCYLIAIQSELEYLDGTVANFDTGIWLHHLMQFTFAQEDPVCSSMPGNYFYGTGNERPIWNISAGGPWGYYVAPGDEWVNGVEIVNESKEGQDVQVTVTYDWVPASSTQGESYQNAELVWVNVGPACGNGEFKGREGWSHYRSDIWKSTVSGPILTARGHLHDGGINSTLYVNGNAVCKTDQSYSPRDGFTDAAGVTHLSGVSECVEVGTLHEGDEVYMEAVYDGSKVLKHNGKLDDIMAVVFMYVGVGGTKA
jgi:hypothetical protein